MELGAGKFDVHVGVDAANAASLAPVLSGADTALLVTPLDHSRGMATDAEYTCNMIRAAAHAGVTHISLVTSWTTLFPEHLPALSSRFIAQEKLLASLTDTKWTILRGGFFSGNVAASLSGSTLSLAPMSVPLVDPRDIGRMAAAIALDSASHHGKVYDVSGEERLTGEQIAQRIAQATNTSVAFNARSVDEQCAHLPPFLQELVRFLAATPDAVPLSSHVRDVTGTPAATFETFVRDHRSMFVKS